MQHWNKDELQFLADSLSLSTKEIYLKFCDEYGSDARTYDSLQKKVKKLRDAYGDEPDELQDIAEQVDKLLEVGQLVIPDINAQRKKELRDEARWWLEGIIDVSKEIVFQPTQPPLQGVGSSLCVLISDTHIGKHNEHFSLDIARERIESIPDRIIAQEGTAKVDEVVLLFAGDLVEGEDIYRTQAHHIECSAIEQVKTASESFWTMAQKFGQRFAVPVRGEFVPGNHGRMSRTANEKTNWDNVVHMILKILNEGNEDKNISFNSNFDLFKTFQVKDKLGMLYHQGVKHTGTPAMREKVAGWSSRKQFDFMCHGHWHEWHIGNWLSRVVICNGCLCGPDDLAERIAKEDTARQAYFYVTPSQPLHGFGVVEWPD